MFLEKNKLKDDSSNDADLVRDLRIILIAAQKNYVLDAPLGDKPIAGADADVMNVWQSSVWWLLDSLVHHALRLRTGTSKTFWTPRSIWDVPRDEISISVSCPCQEVETSDKYFAYKKEENRSTSELVIRMSKYYNRLNQVGVNLPDKIVIDRVL